jgi:membrane protein
VLAVTDSTPAAAAPPGVRLLKLIRLTAAKAWHDRVLGLSAEAAFWQLLSLPPLALALLGGIGYVGNLIGHDTVRRVEQRLTQFSSHVVTPDVVHSVVQPTLHQVLSQGRADVISIGFLLAFWAGSSAMATFVNTITIAYGMRDLRGAVKSRLLALLLYVMAVTTGAALLPIAVLGPAHIHTLVPNWGDWLVRVLYWPVVVVVLMGALALLYHFAPPVRLRWRRAMPGAVLATCLFILGSYLLRLYLSYVIGRAQVYGTLAAPIAALLFFFVLALAVLVGAELNATLEQVWPTDRPPGLRSAFRDRMMPAAGSRMLRR